jgi:uncharacterized ferritin-like protein (DUF455 family)
MAMLFEQARACLEACDPGEKVSLTLQLAEQWQDGQCAIDPSAEPVALTLPGHPAEPRLVHYSELPARKLGSRAGRVAFIHALAHIEFNAINLALDAVCRFRQLPEAFYGDWIKVAAEEAQHFQLLADRLHDFDCNYGDYPAHNGLWDMAVRTAHDVLVRMALVPRVLEARGLDVTPAMIKRLRQVGDEKTAVILERIYTDEIGHVKVGSHWFRYLCRERQVEPVETFRQMLLTYSSGRGTWPVNSAAREQAGFLPEELDMLRNMAVEQA